MKKNKKREKLSKNFWILLGIITFILILILIVSHALFSKVEPEVIIDKEPGGEVTLFYTNSTNALTLNNAVPTTDSVGIKLQDVEKYFDFTVDINLDNAKSVDYEISVLKDDVLSTIPNNEIRIYLEKENNGTYTKVFGPDKYKPINKNTELGTSKGSMVLYKNKKTVSGSENYRLRMWLSDKSVLPNGGYSLEVNVTGTAK